MSNVLKKRKAKTRAPTPEFLREEALIRRAHEQACELLKESPLPVLIGLGDSSGRGVYPILAQEARAEAELCRYLFARYWLYVSDLYAASLRYLLLGEGPYGADRLIAEWWIGAKYFLDSDLNGTEDILKFFERSPYELGVLTDGNSREMFWRIMPPPEPSRDRSIAKAEARLSAVRQMIESGDPKLLERYF